MNYEEISNLILKGDKYTIAKFITAIEAGAPETKKILSLLYPHTGKAHIIGVTGPPGTGKSTLIDKLTKLFLARGKIVGILAVDPTSPFTGGAILGDRIRMQDLFTDERVFIRSMSTRGALGGLAHTTNEIIHVLDASGKDIIFVETVGAGQSEVDIVKYAHTVVIVHVPGLGDDIQVIKAGLFEIGDIFVVNKSDRAGVDATVSELEQMLELNPEQYSGEDRWIPPVLTTQATTGAGVEEVANALEKHLQYLKSSGKLRMRLRQRCELEFMTVLRQNILTYILNHVINKKKLDYWIEKLVLRQLSPYDAAKSAMEELKDIE